MTVYEIIVPVLVGLSALMSAISIVLCWRVERKMAARKHINLANYKAKSHLFYILNDIPTAVFAGIACGFALASGIMSFFSPVIMLYALTALLLVPVNGVILYLSITRKKCGRDIRVFDNYYVQVENVLLRKERTLSNIRVCQQRVDHLRNRLTQTIRDFNQNLAVGVPGDFVTSLFAPIDTMISDYVKEIQAFSEQVERNFDVAMQKFLRDGEEPEFHTVPLRTFDETAVDELLTAIKTSYGDQIAGMVVEQVQRGAVKSAKALGNIMSLLHGLEVVVDNETLARFLKSAADFRDRAELANLLYHNRQIPASMVRDIFIPENWEWIFLPSMAIAYNRRELTAILTQLLAADRVGMCYRLLNGFDASMLDILDDVLKGVPAKNEIGGTKQEIKEWKDTDAVKMAKAFRLILSNTTVVGNSGNAFENIGYMLYDHMEEFDFTAEEKAKIADIVRSQSYYWARRELSELYTRAMAQGAPMVTSATRVLLQYIVNDTKDFLDAKRLAVLLGEYRETLSFREIGTMRTLIAAWLLLTAENTAVLNAVLHEMNKLPVPNVETGEATLQNCRQYGKALLNHLLQNDRVRLRVVIYRTETARQMLDRLLQL